jgi:ABC-2 type transport system ATP-binding protein
VYAIETNSLSKQYDNGVIGLESAGFAVVKGEIFGYLGPNGSGKTTTVRLLNGTLKPSGGTFSVLGLKGENPREAEEMRSRTATLAENARMYEQLTALENLRFFASIYDLEKTASEKRIRALLGEMGLWEKRDIKLGSFSTGMKKRIHLVRTMLHKPEIIFLDEPTSGLDPESSRHVLALVRRLAKEEGTTIFMCTHNIPQAETICDSFGFLKNGRMIQSGKKEALFAAFPKSLQVRITTDAGTETEAVGSEDEIAARVRGLIHEGRSIYEVLQLRPTLEELYFHYLGGPASEDTNE